MNVENEEEDNAKNKEEENVENEEEENVENEQEDKVKEIDEKYSQNLLPNSLCVSCNFENDRSQQWNYYLNNVMNPDESIGNYFFVPN